MSARAEIDVVGAGIVGRVFAYEAIQAGHAITVWDPDFDQPKGPSAIAAGMLAPWSELNATTEAWVAPTLYGLEWWDRVSATIGDVGFHRSGSLHVAHGRDRGLLEEQYRRVNIVTPNEAMWIGHKKILELDPQLASARSEALWFSREGFLHPPSALMRLGEYLASHANVRRERFLASQHASPGTWIADCRGLSARERGDALRGVRGELIRVRAPRVHFSRPVRMAHPRYPLYVVPRPNHEFVIGATQIETESEDPITVRSSLELLSALFALDPGFEEATVIGCDVGLRPAFADGEPKVQVNRDIESDTPRLRILGTFRHGYALSPWLAKHALALASKFLEKDHANHDQWPTPGSGRIFHSHGTLGSTFYAK